MYLYIYILQQRAVGPQGTSSTSNNLIAVFNLPHQRAFASHFQYVYTCVCIYIYVYTYIHAYIHMRIFIPQQRAVGPQGTFSGDEPRDALTPSSS